MALTEPLDLGNLLIERLAGHPDVFIFLVLILIAILAARWKMTPLILLSMFCLFIVGIYAFGDAYSVNLAGSTFALMVMLGIIVSIAVTVLITKIMNR